MTISKSSQQNKNYGILLFLPQHDLSSLLSAMPAIWLRKLCIVSLIFVMAIPACSEEKQLNMPADTAKNLNKRQFTLAELGEKQILIPKDWWVRASTQNPTFFFISEAENRALYHQWIDYGYDLNLGDSACNYIRNLRPEFELIKTFRKMDFGFRCAWDMEVKNKYGDHYRTIAFASYEYRRTDQANGNFVSYSAPIKQFDELEGKRIASLVNITPPRDLSDVNSEGMVSKVSSGAVRRLSGNGQPALYDIPGFRLVPAGWVLHLDPFSTLEIISPDHKQANSPRYISQTLTTDQRQQLTEQGYNVVLKTFLTEQLYKAITLNDAQPARFANDNLIGFGFKGTGTYQGVSHTILAFIDPSGAVFVLSGPEKTLNQMGGSALFVAITQSDADLLDLNLTMTSEGIASGINQSISKIDPASMSDRARKELNDAWIQYGATQTMLNIVGGSNGQNW